MTPVKGGLPRVLESFGGRHFGLSGNGMRFDVGRISLHDQPLGDPEHSELRTRSVVKNIILSFRSLLS